MPIYHVKISESGNRGDFILLNPFDTEHEARLEIARRLEELYPGNWQSFNQEQYTRLDDPRAGPIAILTMATTPADDRRARIVYLQDTISRSRAIIEQCEKEIEQLQRDE